jgi:hypothetical protein
MGNDSVGGVFTVASGTLNIDVNGSGIKAKNGRVFFDGGSANLTTVGDGISAKRDFDCEEGYGSVILSDGAVTINSKDDGIQAENIDIRGGKLDITTSYDNASTSYYTGGSSYVSGKNTLSETGGASSTKTEYVSVDTGSHKALKGGTKAKTCYYGYTIANDIEFEVKDTGDIQKCEMKDDYVFGKLLLKKRDSELNTMIEGVEFEIRDKDGKVIQTLTTGKDGCAESNLLPICTYDKNGSFDKDITYTVVETKAKDGYILDSTPHEVVFTYGRDKDGNLETDAKAPAVVEYTLDLTNKPTEPKLPQTGERFDARVLMLFSVFLFLIGGAWILSGWKKDEQSEADEDIKE